MGTSENPPPPTLGGDRSGYVFEHWRVSLSLVHCDGENDVRCLFASSFFFICFFFNGLCVSLKYLTSITFSAQGQIYYEGEKEELKVMLKGHLELMLSESQH